MLLRQAGVDARIKVGDFFCFDPTGSDDAVIGNPPFIRYQDFSGEARARSRAAALRAGVGLTNLASSWAAFAVHSRPFLRPGRADGPGAAGGAAEASTMPPRCAGSCWARSLLWSWCCSSERVFPEVQEEVVLLLADGYQQGPTDHRLHLPTARTPPGCLPSAAGGCGALCDRRTNGRRRCCPPRR